MATITPLFKNNTREMQEYKRKLFRHRAKQGVQLLVCAAVVLGAIFGIRLFWQSRTYTSYEVIASAKRSDTLNTRYAEYHGRLLKYSRDGIACVNSENEAVWSYTYNMQQPVLDICQNTVAVADRQGNEVYVFGTEGFQTRITTLLPLQQVSVSARGVIALLLHDSSASWIYLYDKEGKKLAESRCSLEETGQPLSIAISSDGTKLAVSYLQIQNGAAGSCVTFYNFGPVGGNFVDKIVASKVYEGRIIPRVKYLDDSICVAVSDGGITYYEGKEIPEEKAAVTEEDEVHSLFFGEKTVGLVVENADKNSSKYEVHVYNRTGELILKQRTDLAYSQVKLSGSDLILFSENACEIYSKQGVLRYAGTFDGSVTDIYKGTGSRKYTVLFSDRTEEIKLL